MFEKIKQLKYRNYCYECISTKEISTKNTKYIEIKKEDLKYANNGWANLIEYIRFTDDNSRIIKTIPEFFDLILNCDEIFDNNIPSDKIYDLLIKTFKEKAEILGFLIGTNNIYGIYFGANKINNLNLFKKQKSSIRFFRDKPYDMNIPFNRQFTAPQEHEFQVISSCTLINNKCVSRSDTTYLNPFEEEVVDISIGTGENHRQKGYAVSNVVSLAEYLLSDNEEVRQVKEVMYSTNSININSQRTAQSAGFVEVAKEFIIGFKRRL